MVWNARAGSPASAIARALWAQVPAGAGARPSEWLELWEVRGALPVRHRVEKQAISRTDLAESRPTADRQKLQRRAPCRAHAWNPIGLAGFDQVAQFHSALDELVENEVEATVSPCPAGLIAVPVHLVLDILVLDPEPDGALADLLLERLDQFD